MSAVQPVLSTADTAKKTMDVSNGSKEWQEMLETEKAGLVERVYDLERQVLEHKDEIVCLKSTLADVLRRLATIDNSYE
ncbi:AGAP012351-PA, partial [Anopheles gambiae str. PEST]